MLRHRRTVSDGDSARHTAKSGSLRVSAWEMASANISLLP